MIKTCKLLLLSALVIGLSSNSLLAGDDGDNGAKQNATIDVENQFGFPVGVIIDGDEDELEDLAQDPNPTQEEFEALGGRILMQSGDDTSFEVKAGTHDVLVVNTLDFSDVAEVTIDVDQGETRNLFVVPFRESIALLVAAGDLDD